MMPVAKNLKISAAVTTGVLLATAFVPQAFVPQASANQPAVATVQSLTAGDHACYVEVIDAGGVYSIEYATFEICEQDLVGQDVELIYETNEILADSCEGNLDCGETETVMQITQAIIIEPPTVGTV